MAAQRHLHAAIHLVNIVQRHLGCQHSLVVDAGPVAQVLVPADMVGLAQVRWLADQLVVKEAEAFGPRQLGRYGPSH